MGARPRDGFALLAALLVGVVVLLLAAAAVAPNVVARFDRVRVGAAHAALSALTAGAEQIVAFNTELGTYPARLSQLATPVTTTHTDLCGKAYTSATVTSWRPYLDRVVPAGGMPVSIGIAQDSLVRQDVDNQNALLIVNVPGVAVEDAEALDRRTDATPSSTAGTVQWGAASSEGLVTLQWTMEISACPGAGGGGGGGKNNAPTSSFTFACTGLACSFTDASSDSDGSVVAWSWDFGTGATSTAQSPAYTFPAAGTYTVSLTVTDDAGATGTSSQPVTVAAPGTIVLAAAGYTSKGDRFVDLSWSGAAGTDVDVYRDGVLITTTPNDGAYTDALGKSRGTFTYQVCEAGTTTCSNVASVIL